MRNEKIVSTGIYYYDQENITDSQLHFRQALRVTNINRYKDKDGFFDNFKDSKFDVPPQEIGYIETKEGRCIAFPNLYQHRISPFTLKDKTKPGHRKVLVFFLVDPS
mmetsp:Transcript_1125/g.1019  ORF Transcript_1125/g.1019 Transcript_1125/m.1019 type:complete len:107 (-) Transcript_1125:431-751(-)